MPVLALGDVPLDSRFGTSSFSLHAQSCPQSGTLQYFTLEGTRSKAQAPGIYSSPMFRQYGKRAVLSPLTSIPGAPLSHHGREC